MRWLVLPLVMLVAACSGSEKPKNDLATGDPHPTKTPPPAEDDPHGQPAPASPDPVPDPNQPTASKDAGHDAAPADAGFGVECTKLAACCDQIAGAGEDPTTCRSVLSTRNEDACFTQHDRYKSYGDCS